MVPFNVRDAIAPGRVNTPLRPVIDGDIHCCRLSMRVQRTRRTLVASIQGRRALGVLNGWRLGISRSHVVWVVTLDIAPWVVTRMVEMETGLLQNLF